MKSVLLIIALIMWAAQPVTGQDCDCIAPGDPGFEAGVVWQGSRSLSLPEIASLLAPILWFSSDEPLLIQGQGLLPHPHPCDPDQSKPVVYYQVRGLRLAGHSPVTLPEQEDAKFWDKVVRLTIRYYFYYTEDRGLAAHRHDLEVADFEAALENTEDGCRRIRLIKVTGSAHGLDWYYNELEVKGDTRFPLTLLIEEGKHAVCPDRNADGIYTPGYDVNHRINDAWGVRDVLGSGVLGSSSFEASMTKPREFRFRVLPPENPLACRDVRNSSYARSDEFLGRYELRAANRISACDDMEPGSENLLTSVRKYKFGSAHKPSQGSALEFRDLARRLTYTKSWLPPISLRRDRAWGLGITPAAMELGQFGYLAARINWIYESGDISVEGMMTPSASQFFSWYVTTGIAREYDLIEIEMENEGDPYSFRTFTDPEWKFVTEIGVKLRARVPGKWRLLTLGYHFAGVRIGFRSSGIDNIENLRLILEFGAGIF